MRQKRGRKIRVGSVRVTVYARHGANCAQKADSSGSVACDCIKWMQFASGKRESTNQWTWAAAEKVARERAAQLAGVADIPQVRKSELMLVDAIEKYMDWRERDCKSNDKHRLMTGKLLAYCKAQQVDYLAQVTASLLSNFKSTLNYATHLDKSNSLKIHWSIVGVFFNWCVGEGHLTMSPMPSGPQNATPSGKPDVVPFSQSKMDRIIVAVDRVNGWDYERQNRVRTLIWMMRWSGMAIRDTATLPRHKLQGTSVVGLDRSKTGVAAYPQIPEWVADALVTLPCDDSEYFFWYRGEKGQKVKDTTIVHYYEADLRKVFAAAGIEGHSHQFRHTFITEQLAAGTPIERVAEMAGNSPDEIRKTYKHWIPKMHEQLKQEAAMAWVKMGLDAKGNPISADRVQ